RSSSGILERPRTTRNHPAETAPLPCFHHSPTHHSPLTTHLLTTHHSPLTYSPLTTPPLTTPPLTNSWFRGRGPPWQGHIRRLQNVPGVRPVRVEFLVVHVRDDRQADEQGIPIWVVVRELNAHRQPLHDLDVVARGVLRRQQGEGFTRSHGEAGDAAFKLTPAAVHVHLTAHPLADAQGGQLCFLEIGIDPDFRERADGHEALPHQDVVAGIDVAAGHYAVNLADDVGVAEVQLGLVQVAACLEELGLGLLDGGRQGDEASVDTVQAAHGQGP